MSESRAKKPVPASLKPSSRGIGQDKARVNLKRKHDNKQILVVIEQAKQLDMTPFLASHLNLYFDIAIAGTIRKSFAKGKLSWMVAPPDLTQFRKEIRQLANNPLPLSNENELKLSALLHGISKLGIGLGNIKSVIKQNVLIYIKLHNFYEKLTRLPLKAKYVYQLSSIRNQIKSCMEAISKENNSDLIGQKCKEIESIVNDNSLFEEDTQVNVEAKHAPYYEQDEVCTVLTHRKQLIIQLIAKEIESFLGSEPSIEPLIQKITSLFEKKLTLKQDDPSSVTVFESLQEARTQFRQKLDALPKSNQTNLYSLLDLANRITTAMHYLKGYHNDMALQLASPPIDNEKFSAWLIDSSLLPQPNVSSQQRASQPAVPALPAAVPINVQEEKPAEPKPASSSMSPDLRSLSNSEGGYSTEDGKQTPEHASPSAQHSPAAVQLLVEQPETKPVEAKQEDENLDEKPASLSSSVATQSDINQTAQEEEKPNERPSSLASEARPNEQSPQDDAFPEETEEEKSHLDKVIMSRQPAKNILSAAKNPGGAALPWAKDKLETALSWIPNRLPSFSDAEKGAGLSITGIITGLCWGMGIGLLSSNPIGYAIAGICCLALAILTPYLVHDYLSSRSHAVKANKNPAMPGDASVDKPGDDSGPSSQCSLSSTARFAILQGVSPRHFAGAGHDNGASTKHVAPEHVEVVVGTPSPPAAAIIIPTSAVKADNTISQQLSNNSRKGLS